MKQYPTIPSSDAFELLCASKKPPAIDVRSEGEYEKAHFAYTVNVPILSDAHRHEVGLIYKNEGSEAARALGYRLVSGEYKEELIRRWCETIERQAEAPALLFCWRGGLRSRIAQDWIYQSGHEVLRVEGGYKALRHEALKVLENPAPFVVLSGMTGSGKTRLLHRLRCIVDLEALAHHRGSAFGAHYGTRQPQQATFENRLAQALYRLAPNSVLEDESPNIGRCHVPDDFYARMVTAPMVRIDTPLRQRALAIHQEYIQLPLTHGMEIAALERGFLQNVERIGNKLGGLECDRIKRLLTRAFAADTMAEEGREAHIDWIGRLLTVYYDKQYIYSLSLKSRKTLFQGPWEDCLEFLRGLQDEQ
jgi:tRNA 2-selenouridine synthase